MNERIKQLLAEAHLFCYDDGTVSLLGETYVSQAEIQKFAELVVRECASQCLLAPIDYVLRGEVHANRIKQRFGVE